MWQLSGRVGQLEQVGLLSLTAQRAARETRNARPSYLGSVPLAQILREWGHPLPKC